MHHNRTGRHNTAQQASPGSAHLFEVAADVAAKEVAGATRGEPPAVNVLRVAPQQVAHRAVVRHLLLPVYHPYLRATQVLSNIGYSCQALDIASRKQTNTEGQGGGASALTWSRVLTAGDSPPCTQNIRLSMSADRLHEIHQNPIFNPYPATASPRSQWRH